mgnify:CR=1 FL=1
MMLHLSIGVDLCLREFEDPLSRNLVQMVAEHIPKQLDTDMLQRRDLRQLIRELVKALLGPTEFNVVLCLSMHLHIRFIVSPDAFLGLNELVNGNLQFILATKLGEDSEQVLVRSKPLVYDSCFGADIFP